MINIYFVEDDVVQAKYFSGIVERYFKDKKLEACVSIMNNEILVPVLKSNLSDLIIFFVDLDLNQDTNGFKVSQMILKENPLAYIVILTSHMELMAEQFNYYIKSFDYIYKSSPRIKERIGITLDAICLDHQNILNKSDISNSERACLAFEFKNLHHKIQLDKIIAIDTDIRLRSTIVHTSDSKIRTPYGVSEILALLPPNFIKSHRSIILNIDEIVKIEVDNSFMQAHMSNGEMFHVSRGNSKEILERFYDK